MIARQFALSILIALCALAPKTASAGNAYVLQGVDLSKPVIRYERLVDGVLVLRCDSPTQDCREITKLDEQFLSPHFAGRLQKTENEWARYAAHIVWAACGAYGIKLASPYFKTFNLAGIAIEGALGCAGGAIVGYGLSALVTEDAVYPLRDALATLVTLQTMKIGDIALVPANDESIAKLNQLRATMLQYQEKLSKKAFKNQTASLGEPLAISPPENNVH